MAQGQHKAKTTASQLLKKVNKNKISRGIRAAPKSQMLLKEREMQRKLAARNIQNTESQMAMKAGQTGKLTIMKPIADKAINAKKENEKKKK
jgi:hypothetical protein